jgi:hypothetical protein
MNKLTKKDKLQFQKMVLNLFKKMVSMEVASYEQHWDTKKDIPSEIVVESIYGKMRVHLDTAVYNSYTVFMKLMDGPDNGRKMNFHEFKMEPEKAFNYFVSELKKRLKDSDKVKF